VEPKNLVLKLIIKNSEAGWALELYKENKQAFFEEYGKYVKQVQEGLAAAHEKTGQLVERVQVLNELNNTVYTPMEKAD
jgi:cellobiose-specific phosphotransferase system component IIA